MGKQSLHSQWTMVAKRFRKAGQKQQEPVAAPESTAKAKIADKKTAKKTDKDKTRKEKFDWVLYCGLYADLVENGITDEKKAVLHFEKHGKQEARITTLSRWLKNYGFEKSCFPPDFSLQRFAELNDVKLLEVVEAIEKFLKADKPPIIKVSSDNSENAQFFLELGKHYDMSGKADKAYNCYMYSNYFQPNGVALEHLGNILFGLGAYTGAALLYGSALKIDKGRKWCYKNLTDSYSNLRNYSAAVSNVFAGLKRNADFKPLEDAFNNIIDKYWQEKEPGVTALCMSGERDALITETANIIDFISDAYRNRALLFSEPLHVNINPERVLIIGDFGLPQCRRYRIYQKLEQLTAAGYEATAMPWIDAQLGSADPELCYSAVKDKNKVKLLQQRLLHEEAIAWHDIIIFYRVPAFPHIVKSIIQARALGKLTFYEIDDLLFDPIYPPPLESYGGYVKADDYIGLLRGMAFYRAAARLCQYGIASTKPLAVKLEGLVETRHCYLHRNGLDANTPSRPPRVKEEEDYIDIFYGSGTHAHNVDFIAEVLPALDKILAANVKVRLVVVGYLQLPGWFMQKHSEQVVVKPFVELAKYWNYLAQADVNIAVLLEDEINHCKSELKWFEAACLGIPTVVSRTRNYVDVIRHGEDGFIVSGTGEWFDFLGQLVNNAELRLRMGEAAMLRVREEYSVPALAKNIRQVIESAINDYKKPDNGPMHLIETEDMKQIQALDHADLEQAAKGENCDVQ
ncbi:MAG: tetratricopeptide repeat-containing glycosyltransferase family protein [Gammaproteobacteria bacterium]